MNHHDTDYRPEEVDRRVPDVGRVRSRESDPLAPVGTPASTHPAEVER